MNSSSFFLPGLFGLSGNSVCLVCPGHDGQVQCNCVGLSFSQYCEQEDSGR